MQNSHLGDVFSWRGEIAISVFFENLWSLMCTRLVFEWLPHEQNAWKHVNTDFQTHFARSHHMLLITQNRRQLCADSETLPSEMLV